MQNKHDQKTYLELSHLLKSFTCFSHSYQFSFGISKTSQNQTLVMDAFICLCKILTCIIIGKTHSMDILNQVMQNKFFNDENYTESKGKRQRSMPKKVLKKIFHLQTYHSGRI